MTTKINSKITGYSIKKEQAMPEPQPAPKQAIHEGLKRPDVLHGSTYKIKTPQSEHALYVTINDMVLDDVRHPYEIFLNSKNMEQYQYVLAMTRLISAVWRKGGNAAFIGKELQSVFDPKGGYFKKGGVFMTSLVAEIGHVIDKHLKEIGIN